MQIGIGNNATMHLYIFNAVMIFAKTTNSALIKAFRVPLFI